MSFSVNHGDCLEVLATMPDNSIDSIVTDPPYGLSFMGKKWDYDVPSEAIWRECLRVLKPGGHLLAFAGTRTQHRMAVRIEDAGFEIRDMIAWVYGSGFPKSLDVSKAIDKAAGAEREVVGLGQYANRGRVNASNQCSVGDSSQSLITAPATDAARQWQGWGTALKPALEPITVARKPLEGTVAENVLKWHTGAVNVDGCRVGGEQWPSRGAQRGGDSLHAYGDGLNNSGRSGANPAGRWPANLIHDGSEEVMELFPHTSSGKPGIRRKAHETNSMAGRLSLTGEQETGYGDDGSAARFFKCCPSDSEPSRFAYVPKASKKDRDEGLDSIRTVKHITGLCKSENMELAELLQKVTSESIVKWGIDESGESITGLCLSDSLSITLTEISKITTSQICNLWTLSRTNESTAAVNCAETNGGNRAENAEKSNLSPPNTTSESQAESVHGAKSVVSKMLSEISDGENWKNGSNFHATVKPTDLMRYLCRLVTCPGGVVLDPFTGSGSTGKAATLEGFNFIGIEREAEYVEIARARIEAAEHELRNETETDQTPLLL